MPTLGVAGKLFVLNILSMEVSRGTCASDIIQAMQFDITSIGLGATGLL